MAATVAAAAAMIVLANNSANSNDTMPTFFWKVGKGKCPECFEPAKECCSCMGRVCPNGHLSVISKYFSPCSRHDVLDCATKSTFQKLRDHFTCKPHYQVVQNKREN